MHNNNKSDEGQTSIVNSSWRSALEVAVIIPCYNEEGAIARVVIDFQMYLPGASIYVYDNNSTDNTIDEARDAGALIRKEYRQGKGFVVRRMFADVDADVYVMVDGDDTYDISAAPKLVNVLIEEDMDMVIGLRSPEDDSAYRKGHKLGNKVLTGLVQIIFGKGFDDILSGYRVFSRRFIKSFPQFASGFEIETELTIHALQLQMPTAEVATRFKNRPEGTESKLKTLSDGFRILLTIYRLLKQGRPMLTFAVFGTVLTVGSIVLAYPILLEFIETGLVPRFPTAILSTGMMILGFLSYTCGTILDIVTKGRQEAKRMSYLSIPSTQSLITPNVGKMRL